MSTSREPAGFVSDLKPVSVLWLGNREDSAHQLRSEALARYSFIRPRYKKMGPPDQLIVAFPTPVAVRTGYARYPRELTFDYMNLEWVTLQVHCVERGYLWESLSFSLDTGNIPEAFIGFAWLGGTLDD